MNQDSNNMNVARPDDDRRSIFQMAFDGAASALLVVDSTGRITHANRRAEQLFGYGRDELCGASVDMLVPDQLRDGHAAHVASFFANPSDRPLGTGRELMAQHRDGSQIPVEIGLAPIRTDRGMFVLCAVIGIGPRRQADDQLAQQNEELQRRLDRHSQQLVESQQQLQLRAEELRVVLEQAGESFIATDAQGHIIEWNPCAEKLFGWSRQEALGRQLVDTIIPPDQRASHREGLRRLETSGQGPLVDRRVELTAMDRQGREFPVEMSLRGMRHGDTHLFYAFVRDVTERQRFEEELVQMNHSLQLRTEELKASRQAALEMMREIDLARRRAERAERHLAEKLEELSRTCAELERSNLQLQEFVRVASHDLQEPLRSIGSFCELLGHRYTGRLDAQADEWIRHAVGGARLMRTLIDALLEYSRLESQGQPLARINLRAAVDDALVALKMSVAETEAQIRCGPLPTVIGDQAQLVQLFQNLISNAIKYSGEDRPQIDISAEREEQHWVIRVRDEGIGIEPRHHQRIFDLFKRLHTRQAYPGTGIGLAICRRIVQRHAGRIWVESEPEKGSMFCFTIPAQDELPA